jgi:hypothetical protein
VSTGSSDTVNFVIHNTGAGTLRISGINFSGPNASEFTVASSTIFPLSVGSGSTQTLAVRFAPMASGSRNATINILSNDANESNYDFALSGTGLEIPEINLQGNSTNILDGDATSGATNNTDFGNSIVGTSVSKVFVIQNTGLGNLTVTGINFTGTNASDFALTGAPTFPVTIASATSYSVTATFNPSAVGTRNATMNLNSNDADESTYDFAVSGNGIPSLSVGTLSNLSSMKVFPNPTNNTATLQVELVKAGNLNVSLVDVQGKQVIPTITKELKAGMHSFELNTSSLQNGVYFLQIADGTATANYKLVIMH